MGKQLGFHINASACADCKACTIACQDKNNLPATMQWRRVIQYEGGNWVRQGNTLQPNNVFSYSLSIACMHCQNPICMASCPTDAIYKRDDGVVLIDQSKCIGCRYCEWACPYGGVHFDESKGVMSKCTLCSDLLDKGENPACVDACVMRAIEFGDLDELRAKYGDVNEIEPLPEARFTNPSIVITAHKNSQATGTGTGTIAKLPQEV